MTFGEFVYKKRLINKITCLEFSDRIGVSAGEIFLIENNISKLTLDYVENVADILMLNPNDYDILMQLYNSDLSDYRQLISDKLLENLGAKKPVSAIRVPLELKISKAEWHSVLTYFEENIICV